MLEIEDMVLDPFYWGIIERKNREQVTNQITNRSNIRNSTCFSVLAGACAGALMGRHQKALLFRTRTMSAARMGITAGIVSLLAQNRSTRPKP